MTLPAPNTVEPAEIIAGDTARWKISLKDHPANDGWTLKYTFTRHLTGEQTSTTASTDGRDFIVTLSPAATAAMQLGRYAVRRFVEGTDGSRFSNWVGVIEVKSLAANVDTRSHVRKVLDNLEAVLEGRATDDILDTVIEGTAIRRLPVEQLLMLRDRYLTAWQNEIAAADLAKGLGTGRNIYVRLTRPT